jgi:hypothetical protein
MSVALCGVLMSLLFLPGCGSAVKATYDPAFQPPLGTMVQVGAVVDAAPMENRGDREDLDISAKMRRALEDGLEKAGLLAPAGSTGPNLELVVTIGNYEPGNAFGRWLLPGLGATKLSVECTLHHYDREVGTISVDREVAIGGAYTIGEWEEVFEDVAKNIVYELKQKLKV